MKGFRYCIACEKGLQGKLYRTLQTIYLVDFIFANVGKIPQGFGELSSHICSDPAFGENLVFCHFHELLREEPNKLDLFEGKIN